MKRVILRTLVIFAGLLFVGYAGDYLSVRYRIPANRDQFSTVAVQSYYAVQEKGGKIEYIYRDPENQTCVNSLFPHFGCAPCWYLRRHARKQIDV